MEHEEYLLQVARNRRSNVDPLREESRVLATTVACYREKVHSQPHVLHSNRPESTLCHSSDVIVQIVDARNPLLFRCEDLENYVRELSPDNKKTNVILVNKADLLTDKQR